MMDELQTLTIFYTSHLRGNLDALPRLYTFLQALRQQHDPRAVLLDLGESCAPDIWHCRATGGRSTLIVLDGMGYHAANVSGLLQAGERSKLRGVISMALLDHGDAWRYQMPPVSDEGILFSTVPNPALRLCVLVQPGTQTALHERLLTLQDVAPDMVGLAQVDLRGEAQLIAADLLPLPAGLAADLSIRYAIEFVEEEARHFERQQRG